MGMIALTEGKTYGPSGRSVHLDGANSDVVLPSLTDHLFVGESVLDYALPRDTVDPISFEPSGDISESLILELGERSQERRRETPEFEEIQEARGRWIEQLERTTITFSRSILEEADSQDLVDLQNEISGSSNATFGENAYETEVLHILTDLIALSDDRTNSD